MLELDAHFVRFFVKRRNLIAEQNLGPLGRLVEQEPGEAAARDRDEPVPCERAQAFRAETRDPFAPVADDAKLADMIASRLEAVREPHPLGDVVARAPEVDDIAAGPERRRALDNGRVVSCGVEPVGERRPGNTRARDERFSPHGAGGYHREKAK